MLSGPVPVLPVGSPPVCRSPSYTSHHTVILLMSHRCPGPDLGMHGPIRTQAPLEEIVQDQRDWCPTPGEGGWAASRPKKGHLWAGGEDMRRTGCKCRLLPGLVLW